VEVEVRHGLLALELRGVVRGGIFLRPGRRMAPSRDPFRETA